MEENEMVIYSFNSGNGINTITERWTQSKHVPGTKRGNRGFCGLITPSDLAIGKSMRHSNLGKKGYT